MSEVLEVEEKGGGTECQPVRYGLGRDCGDRPRCLLLVGVSGEVV